jgi:hypothetical protein
MKKFFGFPFSCHVSKTTLWRTLLTLVLFTLGLSGCRVVSSVLAQAESLVTTDGLESSVRKVELPSLSNETLPKGWRRFQYHTYSSMVITLARLAYEHPEVARVYTTQAAFNLSAAGDSCIIDRNQPMSERALSGLTEDERKAVEDYIDELYRLDGLPASACRVWVIEITDRAATHSSANPLADRPQILISGALHGDERIGPTAVTELAAVLVEARLDPTSMLTKSRHRLTSDTKAGFIFGTEERAIAAWLNYLVQHRRITIVPAANAIGFALGERTELGVDPNRDFPWNQANAQECMQSIAARSINELVLANTYQLLLTFHGGANVIGYEWGDLVHCPEQMNCQRNAPAPDVVAMQTIAFALRTHAGAGTHYHARPFEIGTMGDNVYPVAGGMEDWAYGASAPGNQSSLVTACRPTSFGGYDPSRTLAVRDRGAARVIALLVETADDKQPPEETLGARWMKEHSRYRWHADKRLLYEDPTPHEDGAEQKVNRSVEGHIWRNIRLSLQAIDILAPYAEFTSYPSDAGDDQEIGQTSKNRVCWRIGGAYQVFETQLEAWQAQNEVGIDQGRLQSASSYRSKVFRDELLEQVPAYPAVRIGRATRWSLDGRGGQEFCTVLDDLLLATERSSSASSWYLRVRLQADLDWGRVPSPVFQAQPPETPPWSRLARLRIGDTSTLGEKLPDPQSETSAPRGNATEWFSTGLHCSVSRVAASGRSQRWSCTRVTFASEPGKPATASMSGWTKLFVAVSIFLLAPGSFPLLLFISFLLWRLVRGESVHPALVWYEARQRVRFWLQGLGALGTGRRQSRGQPASNDANAVELEETKLHMLTPAASSDETYSHDVSDLEALTRSETRR